jgi:hypothetical protein
MKCVVCKHGETRPGSTTVALNRGYAQLCSDHVLRAAIELSRGLFNGSTARRYSRY